MPKTILIIDDEKTIRWSLGEALSTTGYDTIEADTASGGIAKFREASPDLVLLDMKLPDGSGLDVLKTLKAEDPAVPVIMMTAYAEVETAVEAMKSGAYDFVAKPYAAEKLRVTIANALETDRLKSEIAYLRSSSTGTSFFKQFIGRSPAMTEIFDKIRKIGQSKANTILITGESGSGKELVARAIHACSHDEPRAFMEINCASVPETLLESELFGYEKGAFTDAKTRKKGLVELAEGGTLFLDEIGEMGITLQSRLLRVLENKTFRRVGGVKDMTVNTRIISATNRDLQEAIKDKLFREDLYYRLKVIPLHIPSLRERREDIPLLVNHFIERFNRELGKQVAPAGPDVMGLLVAYEWPGNVRELRNVIERAMLLEAQDALLTSHLPPEIRGKAGGEIPSVRSSASIAEAFFPMTLRDVERIQIERTLEQTNGNKSRAAAILGISRQTLREKLKSFNGGELPGPGPAA
ncbi:MAG: sigma-54 dependent transcriptional regulator [Candidatus Krumholzibacteria bacterium]|nr:sigma-54 dependent transcriptional regulator [Candidatus Krumholzibacteria bacterium]MDH4337128.1 sigma-54 dependent transcriptional regulator [Candidatus Krumholzibacteria bacterium]MDH5271185.1 sigma-54 dependent transcriptional regulator [Candidatus Krumholzibacteria bacterium]